MHSLGVSHPGKMGTEEGRSEKWIWSEDKWKIILEAS